MLGHLSLTTEKGQIVPYEGQDPYFMRVTGETCMIATILPETGITHIDRMFIAKGDRKKGMASEMLNQLCEYCLANVLTQIQTVVVAEDPRDQQGSLDWVVSKGFVLENDFYVLHLGR